MVDSLPVKRRFQSSGNPCGFTLIEILIAIAIVAILSAAAFPLYKIYIDKATVTIGIGTLETLRKEIEVYHIDTGNYPANIDFNTGNDGLGKSVIGSSLLAEFKKNLFAVESYTVTAADYTLTVSAKDSNHTHLVLTPGQIVIQGP